VAELNRRSPVGLRLGLRREGKLDSRSLPGRLYADCTPKWRNYAAESPVGLRLGLSAGVRSSNSSSRSLPSGLYADLYAEVAELADAPDSKSGARKGVWVRFPPSAYGSWTAPSRRRRRALPAGRLTSAGRRNGEEGGPWGKHGFPHAEMRRTQNPVPERACGFDSHLRHYRLGSRRFRRRRRASPAGGSPRALLPSTRKKGARGGDTVFPTLNPRLSSPTTGSGR
jgi:hypothetical protein